MSLIARKMLGESDELHWSQEEEKEVAWATEISHLAVAGLQDKPSDPLSRKLRRIERLAQDIVQLHRRPS